MNSKFQQDAYRFLRSVLMKYFNLSSKNSDSIEVISSENFTKFISLKTINQEDSFNWETVSEKKSSS